MGVEMRLCFSVDVYDTFSDFLCAREELIFYTWRWNRRDSSLVPTVDVHVLAGGCDIRWSVI